MYVIFVRYVKRFIFLPSRFTFTYSKHHCVGFLSLFSSFFFFFNDFYFNAIEIFLILIT